MRTILVAAALGAALLVDSRPAPAAEMPWCGVISIGYGAVYWDCRYRTFEECYPNVLSGNRGFCIQNPAYQGSAPAGKLRRKPRNR
jgi:hypothetical protein